MNFQFETCLFAEVDADQWNSASGTQASADQREGDRHDIPEVEWNALAKGTRVRLGEMERDTPMHTVLREICLHRESMASENRINAVNVRLLCK